MDEIGKMLKNGFYYTDRSWVPDFLNPIPRPFCSHDQALDILDHFKVEEKWETKNELDELLSEYGIFSDEKWIEEKDIFDITDLL